MATINIDDEVLELWENFWRKHDSDKYPNLKNFTNRKLKELIEINNNK